MNYVIEENVPIPENIGRGRPAGFSIILRALKAGKSVLTHYSDNRSICPMISRIGKKTGAKFCTRKEDGRIRVWRIA